MFLGMQENKIALVKSTKEELENCFGMVFDEIIETQDEYILENGQYVKVDEEYLAQKRLTQIEQELKTEDIIFAGKGEIVKEYNGKPYKVRYANDYQTLVLPSFVDEVETKDIWDATELEFVAMTKSEVQALYEFLKPDYEQAFQVRKVNRARLLLEKKVLLEQGEV